MPAPIAALRHENPRRSRLLMALVNSPVAFGLLIIALLAAGWNYLVAESSRDRVAQAQVVLLETERLFSSVKDLETGERGFVLVGGENYLIPYDGARAAIDTGLATLKRLTYGDLRGAFTGETSLEMLVDQKRDFAARVVALRKEQGFEAATDLIRTGEGKRVMDAIRLEAAAIRGRLMARVEKIQRSDRVRGLVLALLTGAAAWSAVALLAGLVLSQESLRRAAEADAGRERARRSGLATLLPGMPWNATAEGTWSSAVPDWCRFTGQPEAAATGFGYLDAVHENDREGVRRAWAEARAAGSAIMREHRLRHRDGTYRAMILRGAPVLGQDGAIQEWIGTVAETAPSRSIYVTADATGA